MHYHYYCIFGLRRLKDDLERNIFLKFCHHIQFQHHNAKEKAITLQLVLTVSLTTTVSCVCEIKAHKLQEKSLGRK
jgi:hypothetical protein